MTPQPRRHDEGEKCCGKPRCVATDQFHVHSKTNEDDFCHCSPQADLKRDLDAIKGTPEGDALGRAIAAPVADAGGWSDDEFLKRVNSLLNKCGTTTQKKRGTVKKRMVKKELLTLVRDLRSSLIDEAVREVEKVRKGLPSKRIVTREGKLGYVAAADDAIAAIRKLKA